MDINLDNLKKLHENLKTLNIWDRLFFWSRVKNLLIDAASDLQKILSRIDELKTQNQQLDKEKSDLIKDLKISNEELIKTKTEIDFFVKKKEHDDINISNLNSTLSSTKTSLENLRQMYSDLDSKNKLLAEKNDQLNYEVSRLKQNEATRIQKIEELENRKNELEVNITKYQYDLEKSREDISKLREENISLKSLEETRRNEHAEAIATLTTIQENIEKTRKIELEEKHKKEIEKLNTQKLTWSNHQENVKQVIKTLCNKHTIEYVEKVSFKGEPDNTLKICDEYVIFDAKSPRGEDLDNFPYYIKEQAEKAKKYAKEENVKKWIFFVVPTNTFQVVRTFVYHLAEYDVFVISIDSIEPIILSLKKIEDYDFAEQLNPEERENICRVLGKFAHLSKRRIQIDTYFISQFMELAYKCENDLPNEILEKVIEFEKADKLNPPQEKRSKSISINELEKAKNKI